MQRGWHLRRRWRRFNRKHGVHLFISLLVAMILALVALLMWMLTKPPGPHH
ncbi:MAG: hypothetical protein ACTHKU_10790 [Verrucomicrobiota bacterium]